MTRHPMHPRRCSTRRGAGGCRRRATLLAAAAVAALAAGAVQAATEGQNNTFFGNLAGGSTTGLYNAFFGGDAGAANSEGHDNTFLGQAAGKVSAVASYNTFVGTAAGFSNSTGEANTFAGSNAGYSNGEGKWNTFVGQAAGYDNVNGSTNAYFGLRAGHHNTASDNTFVGGFAGAGTMGGSTGGSNAYVGSYAGYSATSAVNGAYLGFRAGYSTTTGSNNTFVGRSAGYNTTSGTMNVALGMQAGLGNPLGSRNTFIGSRTRSVGNVSNASAVGYGAQVGRSNALVLGSVAGLNGATASPNVGIGTDAPGAALHVRRSVSSSAELVLLENDSAGAATRPMIQMNNNGGAAVNFTNTASGKTWVLQAGRSGLDRFEITQAGSGGTELVLTNSGDMILRGTLTQNSNVNDKTGIVAVDGPNVLARVQALPISTWRYKDAATVEHLGPMAQDFHAAFGLGADETKIAPGDMAGVALAAIKAQQVQIEALRADNAAKAAAIAALQADNAAKATTLAALQADVQQLTRTVKARFDAQDRATSPSLKVALTRP